MSPSIFIKAGLAFRGKQEKLIVERLHGMMLIANDPDYHKGNRKAPVRLADVAELAKKQKPSHFTRPALPSFLVSFVGCACPTITSCANLCSTLWIPRASRISMSTVGPQLPLHLQTKRKRDDGDDEARDTSETPPKRARSSSSGDEARPRHIIGPAAPPADLSELPTTNPDPDSDSSEDDDFGPSLPPPPGSSKHQAETKRQQDSQDDFAAREAAKKPQREEWMLLPPKQDDWSARVDPTKIKNRKFNTGKGSKAPGTNGGGVNTLWTETPEQKRQRLEDEVMGVKKPAQLGPEDKRDARKEQEARETQRRIQEYNERNRSSSLYNEHKKAVPKEKEDDPSARAFDKEKDVGLGMKVGHAQRKEMLHRAKDFGSRFSSGSYL